LNDPECEPLKPKLDHKANKQPSHKTGEGEPEGPIFSNNGLSGAWIPFGGGQHQCPGKNFAKQEIILCNAVMCSFFGIELLPMVKLGLSKDFYGLGTLPQKGKVPFQVRQRLDRGHWTAFSFGLGSLDVVPSLCHDLLDQCLSF
jgi:Cytochrome P450